jgi:murein L,D-transpeptidase YcbB/YkuD
MLIPRPYKGLDLFQDTLIAGNECMGALYHRLPRTARRLCALSVIFCAHRCSVQIKMKSPHTLTTAVFWLLLLCSGASSAESAFHEAVNQLLSRNAQRFATLPDGETLYGKVFILRMYQENGFRPLWKPLAIRSLAHALAQLAEDGLNPSDYQFPAIQRFLRRPTALHDSLRDAAKTDILLTEAYLRAMYNLYYGKTDPERLDPSNNFARARDGKDRSALLLSWVSQARIDQAFDWARPKNERYRWLKAGLVRYQKIQSAGGWPQIAAGKVILPGERDPRIGLIRQRLFITGDLPSASGPNTHDDGLIDGVVRFQQRHYLTVNGEIDEATLAAMNVRVEARIEQIRVNMERQRWLFPMDAEEFMVVDIAGYTAYWIKDKEIIWQEQIQVGKAYTQTPVFKDELRFIELNPDWSELAGQEDLMGLVKFIFPNRHQVFLHDINHWELLSAPSRTTTNTGSIRIANALGLAERLLQRQGWDHTRIDRIIDSQKTTRVQLQHPLPILIHYSTAWATEDEISFKPDIYARDPKLMEALNGPFIFHKPDLQRTRQ